MAKLKSSKAKKAVKKRELGFYKIHLSAEKDDSLFSFEYNILLKTAESVNNFNLLYKIIRRGSKGGPSTHYQQDLYRAMLIFACAGLDVFVKQLTKTKLSKLITVDKNAQEKFRNYVKNGIDKKSPEKILNTVALALIDQNPREIFLKEYLSSMTKDSLQSVGQLCMVSDASGLSTNKIFTADRMNALKDAFTVRNQIIHEMDINTSDNLLKTRGYRTRRQRISPTMEKHTKVILDLAQDLFIAYKNKFEEFKIETEKGSKS